MPQAPVASGSGTAADQGGGGPAPAWRQFNFFDSEPFSSIHDASSCPYALRSPYSISCIAAGQDSVLVADLEGEVSLLGRDLEPLRTWTAYDGGRCTAMEFAGINGVLVTVGEEGDSSFPVLKVWNLRHKDRQTSAPQLLGFTKVSPGPRPHPVTCLSLTPSLSHLAVGLADGTVLLYRHLDQSLASAASSATKAPLTIPKPKTVHSSPDPITGLGFRSPGRTTSSYFGSGTPGAEPLPTPPSNDRATHLFVVSTGKVLCLVASGKSASSSPAQLDDIGGELGCTRMMPNGDLIVARSEAMYAYGPEGRGACVAYEGAKSHLTGWSRYLVITSPPLTASASSGSATVRNLVNRSAARGTDLAGEMVTRVVVFDLQNKLVAHSAAFEEGVTAVWCEWEDVFVLSDNGRLVRLVEKSRTEKLASLFEKSLYSLAVNVARSGGADEAEVANIYRRYGDYLYGKADYDGAVQQYVKTIGTVQPSFIIRRFLDAQRISNLTSYLQELHNQGVANAEHTTLLLNCYTKLKDHARLDDFIKANERTPRADGELPFDLDTAIRVCRQAGYFEHALYLARQYDQYDEYLRIQIEDREEWSDAIAFIRGLGPEAAEQDVLRYGKQLLARKPDEMTDLMIDLCCGTLDRPQQPNGATTEVAKQPSPYLSYLTRSTPAQQVQSAAASATPASVDRRSGASELARAAIANDQSNRRSGIQRPGSAAETLTTEADPPTAVPQLRQFFAFFADHSQHFIRFLETIADRRWHQRLEEDTVPVANGVTQDASSEEEEEDREAVWSTLLDLYLQASSKESEDGQAMRTKALALLKAHDRLRYETTQALIVCVTYNFVPGIILLYERLGMVDDVMRFWIERAKSPDSSSEDKTEASKNVITTLREHGPEAPHLYPVALRFITSSGDVLSRHHRDLIEILEHVDEERIMPPIAVVQTLSRSGVASVGTVKAYLLKQMAAERQEIDADRGLIQSYRNEVAKKKTEIKELSDPKAPRIFQVTRCSACGDQLDLPAIHFMCKHSYHQRCMGNESECRNCARSHGLVRDIRRNNERLADQHDLFLEEVRESEDGFGQIASAFSKGLLAHVRNAEPL